MPPFRPIGFSKIDMASVMAVISLDLLSASVGTDQPRRSKPKAASRVPVVCFIFFSPSCGGSVCVCVLIVCWLILIRFLHLACPDVERGFVGHRIWNRKRPHGKTDDQAVANKTSPSHNLQLSDLFFIRVLRVVGNITVLMVSSPPI